jgi:hypothetical protein
MTTTAGHSFYIGPIGFFYNQVNDTGSWEPLVLYAMFYFFMSQYLFCRKCNRRLEFNDAVFFLHLLVKQMWGGGGGGHVFFAKYTLNLSYIYPIFSSKKILYSYIIFVKSGLELIFSSPDQVSYSHHLASVIVVRRTS